MNPPDFEYVRQLVRTQVSLVLDEGKHYLVEARLEPLVRRHQLGSLADLVAHLRSTPLNGLHTAVVEAMMTSETSFFRDGHPFDSLRQVVLPELIQKRAGERILHLWSAACATGQEPYSLAMLLRDSFPELSQWTVALLATDVSGEMLQRSRAGRFSQIEVNRGLPARLLVRYFAKAGTDWQLAEEVRRLVEFRQLNLARPWPTLPRMDVVFLRNVLIYFDTETKKAVLGRLARLLRPDGYLVLGGAETTFCLDDSFVRARNGLVGYYQLAPGAGGVL